MVELAVRTAFLAMARPLWCQPCDILRWVGERMRVQGFGHETLLGMVWALRGEEAGGVELEKGREGLNVQTGKPEFALVACMGIN